MQRGLPKQEPIPGVRRIIAVASGKGGVGKSTVATNLAAALTKEGLRTGLLDADMFGPSIPRMLGLQDQRIRLSADKKFIPLEAHQISCMSMGLMTAEERPLVWRGLMVQRGLEQLLRQTAWPPLDLLIIDMPPGTGDTQLSIAQYVPLQAVVLVTTPQDVAVADTTRGARMFSTLNVPISALVVNMDGFVCPHCSQPSQIFVRGSKLGELVDGTTPIYRIPIDPLLSATSDAGSPMVVSHPDSYIAREYLSLARHLSKAPT